LISDFTIFAFWSYTSVYFSWKRGHLCPMVELYLCLSVSENITLLIVIDVYLYYIISITKNILWVINRIPTVTYTRAKQNIGLYVQWNFCNLTPEFSDILWHPTKIYCPKVFLLTKIKPEYSDILYNVTHFPGPLACRMRQFPQYKLKYKIYCHWPKYSLSGTWFM
jgi:hypothetical protein